MSAQGPSGPSEREAQGPSGPSEREAQGPLVTIEAWAEAWRQRDHVAVSALFTDDATYVGALSGELRELERAFAVAARMWRECAVEQFDATLDAEVGSLAAARATYTFSGTTRHGAAVSYEAASTFVLRRLPTEPHWRILRFQESYRKGAAPIRPIP